MKKIILILFALLILVSASFAHGVGYQTTGKTGYGVIFSYADGSPIKYAEIKLYPPDDDQTPFQEGYTDANGGFAFLPDSTGEWTVVVNDGMGHAVTATVAVSDGEPTAQSATSHTHEDDKLLKTAVVVLALLLISLFFYKRKGR